MGAFGNYKGRCVGRVLNTLNEYVPLTIVESLTVGNGVIKYGEEVFAEYKWESDTDFPVFNFASLKYNNVQDSKINEVRKTVKVTNLLDVYKAKIKELENDLFSIHLNASMSESVPEALRQKIKEVYVNSKSIEVVG